MCLPIIPDFSCFKMKMRPRRISGIAGDTNYITLFHLFIFGLEGLPAALGGMAFGFLLYIAAMDALGVRLPRLSMR